MSETTDHDELPFLDDEPDESVADIEFVMSGLNETPLLYATDVQVGFDHLGFQFVFTQYVPPPVVTQFERRELVERGYVPYPVVARVALPPLLVEYLLTLLPERLGAQKEAAADYTEWLAKRREGLSG